MLVFHFEKMPQNILRIVAINSIFISINLNRETWYLVEWLLPLFGPRN